MTIVDDLVPRPMVVRSPRPPGPVEVFLIWCKQKMLADARGDEMIGLWIEGDEVCIEVMDNRVCQREAAQMNLENE